MRFIKRLFRRRPGKMDEEIRSLIDDFWHINHPRRDEIAKAARASLIAMGADAHEALLSFLRSVSQEEKERPLEEWQRRWAMTTKRGVLDVLQQSGNSQCLEPLRRIVESDPSIAEQGGAVLRAIGQRSGIKIGPLAQPQPSRLRPIKVTGDPYVDECFRVELVEHFDGRDWFEIPQAKAASQAGNARRFDEGLRLAESLRHSMPDFYYPYYCAAWLYEEQGRCDEARAILREGLKNAKSKHELCEAMGNAEWRARNLPEAVKWWIRSVALQVSAGRTTNYVPFLHLAYVAEALRLGMLASVLKNLADKISGLQGGVVLRADAANELSAAVGAGPVRSMGQAIQLLATEYLEPKR